MISDSGKGLCHSLNSFSSCVDNSGNWGRGGLFDAVARLSATGSNAYEQASEFGDLHLGDLHLVQINEDNGEPNTHPNAPQWVALAVVQSYNPRRKFPRSGISISDLDVCLAKASFKASRHSASIHMPQINYQGSTDRSEWYNVERLLRKYAAMFDYCWSGMKVLSTPWNEVSVYPIPAALYLIKNLLQYYIFAYVDASGYQILKNFNIITTGVLYRIILKKKLSEIQWSAFLLLCDGCTTAQLNSRIPGVVIPEDIFLVVASALKIELNRAFYLIRDITSGRDLKKFLGFCSGTSCPRATNLALIHVQYYGRLHFHLSVFLFFYTAIRPAQIDQEEFTPNAR
ncbi:hypothetical protein OROMI_018967 [Orobanche minor]